MPQPLWRMFPGLLILLSPCFVAEVSAQVFREFSVFSTTDAPILAEIRDVMEAGDGAVWVSTWGSGIYRIHGVDIHRFHEESGFVSDWTTSFAEDGFGGIWVGTGDGLAHFEVGSYPQWSSISTLAGDDIHVEALLATGDGALIVGTNGGRVLRTIPASNGLTTAWDVLADVDDLGGTSLSDLAEFPGGGLVAATSESGTWVLHGDTWETILPDSHWMEFSGRSDGEGGTELWGVERHEKQIYRYREGQWQEMPKTPGTLLNIYVDRKSNVFALTERGVQRWRNGTWEKMSLGPSVGQPMVLSMLHTGRESVWLGTTAGLVRGSRRAWTGGIRSEGGAFVKALVADGVRREPLLGLTGSGRLAEYEGGQWHADETMAKAKGLSNWWIFPPFDTLWAANEKSLFEYRVSDGSLLRQVKASVVDWDANVYTCNAGRNNCVAGCTAGFAFNARFQCYTGHRRDAVVRLSSNGRRILARWAFTQSWHC